MEVQETDRKKMLRPAPKGFRPEPVARKLRLVLTARDKTIRVGQTFWYRLELQNAGSETVRFWESPSFLKNGMRYDDGKWSFFIKGPDEKRQEMILGTYGGEMSLHHRPRRPIKVPGADKMTDQEVQDFILRDGTRRRADANLEVDLAPGETIVSRPWRWVEEEESQERLERGEAELWPEPTGVFRELWTGFRFDKPGRYRIQAVYNDPPLSPPDEEILRDMEMKGYKRAELLEDHRKESMKHYGLVESNSVPIEVVK